MIFATALATGLFTALLRSAFAVIAVAAAIGIIFLAAFLISSASVIGLVLSVIGFNAGLLTYGIGYLIASGSGTG